MHNKEIEISREDLQKEINNLRSELDTLKNDSANIISEKERLFTSIFEESGVGIAVIDYNKHIINFNKSFAVLFGYAPNELYNLTYLDLIPDEKKENASQFIEAMFSSKLNKYQSQLPYIKSNKEIIWLKLTATVINDDEGKPKYILGMGEDITEHLISEEKLKKAKEKAEESDRLKTAFLTNMSHEVRTPLNAIIGFSDLLADRNTDNQSRKEFVEQINISSNMLIKLIDDIIDISQIDAGKLNLTIKTFNVSNILNSLLTAYKTERKINSKDDIDILFHNPYSHNTIYLKSDEFRFKQIFEHLLNNALKYTHKGFIEFGFDLDDNNFPVFYVRDTGIGIPEDKKDQIFNHFTKIESRTNLYRGTGIGLTITQKLVELLGGKIWVDSHLGIGSVFYFSIPSKIELIPSLTNKTKSFNDYNWDGKSILVAEDEDSNYEVIKATLARTHAKLIRVRQGDHAVEYCKQLKLDLILMDIKMPGLDGIEATKQIKVLYPDLPIIAQTAYVHKDECDTCLNAGCDEYIPKPIKSFVLLDMIEKLI
jgi:PAS domain S-box-containing protein